MTVLRQYKQDLPYIQRQPQKDSLACEALETPDPCCTPWTTDVHRQARCWQQRGQWDDRYIATTRTPKDNPFQCAHKLLGVFDGPQGAKCPGMRNSDSHKAVATPTPLIYQTPPAPLIYQIMITVMHLWLTVMIFWRPLYFQVLSKATLGTRGDLHCFRDNIPRSSLLGRPSLFQGYQQGFIVSWVRVDLHCFRDNSRVSLLQG